MRALNDIQKRFLLQQKMNPSDFLSIYTAMDYYKFYHIKTCKEVFIRR